MAVRISGSPWHVAVALVGSLLALGVALALLAITAPPPAGSASVDPGARSLVRVDMRPLRGEVRPLRLRRQDGTGFVYRCMECHRFIETGVGRRRLVAEHVDIRLDHGRNDYCLNCHHPFERDAYVDHDGSVIPAETPAELCAKCHGLVHRDWDAGVHGRSEGHWNVALGDRRRLLCIQCHDPHAPAIPPLAPLPGPRMAPGAGAGPEEER